jgi:hypothetical protein
MGEEEFSRTVRVNLISIEKTLEKAGLSLTQQEAERIGVAGVIERIKQAYQLVNEERN